MKVLGLLSLVMLTTPAPVRTTNPQGFQNAQWGMNSAQVRTASDIRQWQKLGKDAGFPPQLGIDVYSGRSEIAGYPASIKYYFYQERFFQSTVSFDFSRLANFDFNYNVFRSVDSYYKAIHDQTLTFVRDIYDLLTKKYGRKEPVFEKLNPRDMFRELDLHIRREVWNLRYHPYEYYRKIVTSSYARWDYPKTRVLFSVNICAQEKRFDYLLSLTSLDLEREISAARDSLRAAGL